VPERKELTSHPNYGVLKMLGYYPMIFPTILKTESGEYQLFLDEQWPEPDENYDTTSGFGKEDTLWVKADWCNEKLKIWPGCTKVAFDRWNFKELYQLEKFITLYQLTWQN
jgi:hypothetical protein